MFTYCYFDSSQYVKDNKSSTDWEHQHGTSKSDLSTGTTEEDSFATDSKGLWVLKQCSSLYFRGFLMLTEGSGTL